MRRRSMIFVALLFVLGASSPALTQVLFEDQFNDPAFGNWTLWGDPLPQWHAQEFGRNGVFDNMGDAAYASGAVSNQTFDLSNGFVLEAEMLLDFSNSDGCWARPVIGIGNPTYDPSWGGYNGYLGFGFDGDGQACWCSDPSLRGHMYIRGDWQTESGWETLGGGDCTQGPIDSLFLADYDNRQWHIFRIEVGVDRIPRFYFDGNHIYTGMAPLTQAVFNGPKPIYLGACSSGSAGKGYHDWVRLMTPSCAQVTFSVQADMNQCMQSAPVFTAASPVNVAFNGSSAEITWCGNTCTIRTRYDGVVTYSSDPSMCIDVGTTTIGVSDFCFPGLRGYTLMARVGNGTPFTVFDHPSFTMQGGQSLTVGFNDDTTWFFDPRRVGEWYGTFSVCSAPDGLVAYYPFDGNANDSSGHGLDGTIHGATLGEDRFCQPNSAYHFNGVDQYIAVPDNDLLDTGEGMDVSVCVWFRTNNVNDWGTVSKYCSVPPRGGWMIEKDEGFLTFEGRDRDDFRRARSLSSNPNDGLWHFAVGMRSGSVWTLWFDGALAASTETGDNSAMDNVFPLIIGAHSDIGTLNNYFDGDLDDIRIYNRALSPSEIQTLYGGPLPSCVCNPSASEEFLPKGMLSTSLTALCDGENMVLRWDKVPGADFYHVYAGPSFDDLQSVGTVTDTSWTDPGMDSRSEQRQFYSVTAGRNTAAEQDRSVLAYWPIEEGIGTTTEDASGNGHGATLHGAEWIQYDDNGNGCWAIRTGSQHYADAPNNGVFYNQPMQIDVRLRVNEIVPDNLEMIVGNTRYATLNGGFMFMVERYGKLQAVVWNGSGWQNIVSLTTVPVGEWFTTSLIINGVQSMILLDGIIVAAGNLPLNNLNNNMPLTFGAQALPNGERQQFLHGDIAWLRITTP